MEPEFYVWSMTLRSTLTRWLTDSEPADEGALQKINEAFASFSTEQRVEQATELLPGAHVLTSSFGAQAAVMHDFERRLDLKQKELDAQSERLRVMQLQVSELQNLRQELHAALSRLRSKDELVAKR